MANVPKKEDRLPIILYSVAVFLFQSAVTIVIGWPGAMLTTGWAIVGVVLMTSWETVPTFPRTLPGHLIRLVWSMAWPYYAAERIQGLPFALLVICANLGILYVAASWYFGSWLDLGYLGGFFRDCGTGVCK